MASVAWLLAASLAHGQGFFGEFQMLRAGSKISLDRTLDSTDQNTQDSAGLYQTTTEQKTEEGAARYEAILFRFDGRNAKNPKAGTLSFQLGWTGKRERSTDTDSTFTQDRDEKISHGYFGIGFNDVAGEGFGLMLVASRNSQNQLFQYSGYQESQSVQIDSQYGAMLTLGFLLVGAVKGEQLLDLTIEDPGRPTVNETYRFDFTGSIVGFHIHLDHEGEGGSEFNGILIHKKTPFTPGSSLNLDAGEFKIRQLYLKLGPLILEGTDTYRRLAVLGEFLNESREKKGGIGLQINNSLTVSLNRVETKATNRFNRLNNPSLSVTDQGRTLLGLEYRFGNTAPSSKN